MPTTAATSPDAYAESAVDPGQLVLEFRFLRATLSRLLAWAPVLHPQQYATGPHFSKPQRRAASLQSPQAQRQQRTTGALQYLCWRCVAALLTTLVRRNRSVENSACTTMVAEDCIDPVRDWSALHSAMNA